MSVDEGMHLMKNMPTQVLYSCRGEEASVKGFNRSTWEEESTPSRGALNCLGQGLELAMPSSLRRDVNDLMPTSNT